MKDKQRKLLQLTEEMQIGMMPEEIKACVENLSDVEVDELLSKFEYVRAFQNELAELCDDVDEEAYDAIEQEYSKEVTEIEAKLSSELQGVQEKEDNLIDEEEKELTAEQDVVQNKYQEQAEQMEMDAVDAVIKLNQLQANE